MDKLKILSTKDTEVLNDIIYEWDRLSKRYSLTLEDQTTIKYCQHYAFMFLEKYFSLRQILFTDYYEETICEYIGKPYKIKLDKSTQIKFGYDVIFLEKKALYLFPLEK